MERGKKKRSPNFTLEEKENLLSLVTKYKGVVESKRSGAYYIQKKNEAWMAITKQFNSLSTTGPRVEGMLKHFYNNIKHRARKVSASGNKQRYLAELPIQVNNSEPVPEPIQENVVESDSEEFYTEQVHTAEVHTENVTLMDAIKIQDLKKKWSDEKKNIKKTGGGVFDPVLTDADHQVLAILDNQIRPMENPYDEAAQYFGETLTEDNSEDKPTPEPKEKPKRKRMLSNILLKKTSSSPKIDSKQSAESLKKIYFKKKIELTFYQKKNEMLKYRNEQKKQQLELRKHELQMKILKKQLEKSDSNVTE